MDPNDRYFDEYMAGEEWRPVPLDFPYWASTEGRIFSEHRGGRVLTPYTNEDGSYLIVDLRNEGRRKQRSVHTLVLSAHEGRPEGDKQADHINGDTHDNRLANLRWLDREVNEGHAVAEDDSIPTAQEAPF